MTHECLATHGGGKIIVLSTANGCVNLIFGSYCKKTKTQRNILRYYGWELPGECGGIWHEGQQGLLKKHLRRV